MQLPPELVLVLSGLIGTVVAQGLKSLGKFANVDLSGSIAAITGAVVAFLVALVNGLLLQVPAEYENAVRGVLAFLVILMAPAGVYDFIKRK